MNTTSTNKWLVDLKNLTCRNTENQMVITFEKKGSALTSKVIDLPLDLIQKWAFDPNGGKHLRKAVIEADEIFFKEYFNREIEEKRIGA